MQLTLGDLLGHEALELELVAGGDRAGTVPIGGAHAIEIDEPSRWLPPGWLMLTTGLRLRGDAAAQRRLVAELHEHGQAGLGWAVGLVVRHVPKAVVEEAGRLGLPVFAVPIHVPFRDVIAYVNGSLISDDLYVTRRLVSMQDYLMDALTAADPVAAIVERVGTMLDADVLFVGPRGRAVDRRGRLEPAQVAPALTAPAGEIGEAVVEGRRTFAAAVSTAEGHGGWLVVAPPSRPFADRLAKPLLRSAVRLLGLLDLLDHREAATSRARRAEVLVASLGAPAPERALALDVELRALGLDVGSAGGCGVAWATGGREPAAALAGVEAALGRSGRPFLLAGLPEGLAAVVQGDAAAVAEAVRHAGLPAGLGRRVTTPAGFAASVAEARRALRHAGGAGAAVVAFDELDPASWLLGCADAEEGVRRATALLEPLRGQGRLLETLRRYFAADLDVAVTAADLGLHVNTVRYRLRRIEALMGLRLAAPASIANIHLALLGERG
jgi:PucR family transcriptional regulator, purine catabolism regulatory protein